MDLETLLKFSGVNSEVTQKETNEGATWPKSDDDESAPQVGDTVMHDKHGMVKVIKVTDTDMNMEPAEYEIETKSGKKIVSYDQLVMGESKSTNEAVGVAADPIMDLCDDVGCDPDHPIFAELVRYMDGDTIRDFVSDYRRNHDMPNEMDETEVNEDDIEEGSIKYMHSLKAKGKSDEEIAKELDMEPEEVKKAMAKTEEVQTQSETKLNERINRE